MAQRPNTSGGSSFGAKYGAILSASSLSPFLALVAFGSTSLSSSSYGPEVAFEALGDRKWLALPLAAAIAGTVAILYYSYSTILRRFPYGGGTYSLTSRVFGPTVGAVAGMAVLINNLLLAALSSVSAAMFFLSLLPHGLSLLGEGAALVPLFGLLLLNLRGVRHPLLWLSPVVIVFAVTHAVMAAIVIAAHPGGLWALVQGVGEGIRTEVPADFSDVNLTFVNSYALATGTLAGLENVWNALRTLREPHVETGRRTMLAVAVAVATSAALLLVAYAAGGLATESDKPLNLLLAEQAFSRLPGGWLLVKLTLISEGGILLAAAQAGLLGGMRMTAKLAADRLLPRRFANLSDRLTMSEALVATTVATATILLLTRGHAGVLIVMYTVNLLLSFTLSQAALLAYLLEARGSSFFHISVHAAGLVLRMTILTASAVLKNAVHGLSILAITATGATLAKLVRRHYEEVERRWRNLDELVEELPLPPAEPQPLDPLARTAVLLVERYDGLGIATLLSVVATFPKIYRNVVFVSIGVLDTENFKGAAHAEELEKSVRQNLSRYVELGTRLGFAAGSRYMLATEPVEAAAAICGDVSQEFPYLTVFLGNLAFRREGIIDRLLHSGTAFVIQRKLQWQGMMTVLIPVQAPE